MMCISYVWCLDVKYVWFAFWLNPCNYHDVILHKSMWFLYKPMETRFCIEFLWTYGAW
jgi:hypothetical protein